MLSYKPLRIIISFIKITIFYFEKQKTGVICMLTFEHAFLLFPTLSQLQIGAYNS